MTIVFKISDVTKNKMIDFYKNKTRDTTPPYAIFQADESDTVITMYQSNKVVFQGVSADIDANIWRDTERKLTGKEVIEKEKKEKTTEKKDILIYKGNIIGSDEVGTGDYFGPVVVTAAFLSTEDETLIKELKIRDSKKMDDETIRVIVPQILNKVKYASVVLNNSDYNEKYSKDMNMNKIKAILHNKVLGELLNKLDGKPDYVIVDQFVNEKKYYEYLKDTNSIKGITFMEKAEDQVLSVAIASIISRYIFLKEFDRISDEYNIVIPKGAGSEVDKVGVSLVQKYGKEELSKIAKVNFKNTEKILKEV